jgi:hypothetical protein
MSRNFERLTSCAFSWWWSAEATDEPAREDARPTSRFMVPMRREKRVEVP